MVMLQLSLLDFLFKLPEHLIYFAIFFKFTFIFVHHRHTFKSKNVYVYAWHNVWESGLSGCAYRLANNGYKVFSDWKILHV